MLAETQRGVALIIVLWLVSLLTIMGLSHARNVHIESRLVENQINQVESRALTEAGVYHAIFQLISASGSTRQYRNLQQVEFESGRVNVSIQDATGLFDLNTGPASILEQILEHAGVASSKRLALVDAVLDWRDADDFRHVNGAEKSDYRLAGLSWEPRNARFLAVEELRYVLGMTDEIYKKVSPYLTIHSSKNMVDINHAPAWLITALGLPMAGDSNETIKALDHGSIYRISAWTSKGERAAASVEATVKISAAGDSPYRIYSWKESVPVDHFDTL